MNRQFRIEGRLDGPIRDARWFGINHGMSMREVENHCRDNEVGWKKGLYRLVELKPLKVTFETNIILRNVE